MKDIWMKCVWCYLWWRVSGLARSVLDCVSPVSARSPASTGRLTKDRLLILCNLQHQPALGGPTHVLILLMREGEAHAYISLGKAPVTSLNGLAHQLGPRPL